MIRTAALLGTAWRTLTLAQPSVQSMTPLRKGASLCSQSLARPALAAVLILMGTGCPGFDGDPPREDTCVEGTPPEDGMEVVILGTTPEETFVPLAPLDPVMLFFGPQGGQHIYISAKLFAKTPGRWEHRFELVDSATNLPAGGSVEPMVACAPGWTVAHNMRVFVDSDSLEAATLNSETLLSQELGDIKVTASIPITIKK